MSSSGRMRRDDALVAVATGHLVADLQLALDGDVDLHHLDDARRQLVALLEAVDLVAEDDLRRSVDRSLRASRRIVARPCSSRVLDRDARPVLAAGSRRAASSSRSSPFLTRTLPLSSTSLPPSSCRASSSTHLAEVASREMILTSSRWSLRSFSFSCVLDVLGALVLLGALAGEDRASMTMPLHARRDAQRAVADVAGLLAEDGAQELLFRRELGLALRRDLADEDVARLHLGADADDAATRRGP